MLKFCLKWIVLPILLLTPHSAWPEERAAAGYHGLRFLGLNTQESNALQQTAQEAVAATPTLTLLEIEPNQHDQCQQDIQCHCQKARLGKIARLIYGNIGRLGSIFTFELVLVDAQKCSVENSVFVSESLDFNGARLRLKSLINRLTTPRDALSTTVIKEERGIQETPAVVSVFSAEKLRRLGITKLDELLPLIPGFEVADANWGSKIYYLGERQSMLFLVDGTPLTNPLSHVDALGADIQLSLKHVDRVEIVRRPGSVLWGPQAFLGMINLISRLPQDETLHLNAEATWGTLNSGEAFASVEQNRGWLRYYLSSNFAFSPGSTSFVADSLYGLDNSQQPVWGNRGWTNPQNSYNHDFVAKLEFVRRLQFAFYNFAYQRYYEISSEGGLLSADEHGKWDKTHRVYNLAWDDTLPGGFHYRLSASRYEYHFWEDFKLFPPNAAAYVNGQSVLQGNNVTPISTDLLEGRLYHNWENDNWNNQILLGSSYQGQYLPNMYARDIGLSTASGDWRLDLPSVQENTFAGYAYEQIGWRRKLWLSGGARWEKTASFSSIMSNEGALIWNAGNYHGKLIYSEGYRQPSAGMRYSTIGIQGNLDLRAERSRSLSFETGGKIRSLSLRLGGVANFLSDKIILIPIDPPVNGFNTKPINRDSSTIYSSYAELDYTWRALKTFANYTLQNNSAFDHLDQDHRSQVPPTHLGNLGFQLLNKDALLVYGTATLSSPRQVWALDPNVAQGVYQRLPTKIDMRAGFWLLDFFPRWDFGLKMQNPLQLKHKTAYAQVGPSFVEERQGSEIFFTVRYNFEAGRLKEHAPNE